MSPFFAGSLCLYALLVAATIVLLYRGVQRPYFWCKLATSMVFLLIPVIFSKGDIWGTLPTEVMNFGLLACYWGDVGLARAHEIDNQLRPAAFREGVIFFLLAHLLFSVVFFLRSEHRGELLAAALVVGGISMLVVHLQRRQAAYDYQGFGKLCTVYAFFVGAVLGAGLEILFRVLWEGSASADNEMLWLGIGGVIFWISDFLISNKFFRIKKWAPMGALVLLFYYGATLCLAFGLLKMADHLAEF